MASSGLPARIRLGHIDDRTSDPLGLRARARSPSAIALSYSLFGIEITQQGVGTGYGIIHGKGFFGPVP